VYKDLPVDNSGKVVYAQNMYNNSLKEHFRKEEQVIRKVQHCHAEIERTGKEIILEHELLTKSFLDLGNSINQETDLDQLGIALELHIRKEERILFPLIQQHCGEEILNEIDLD
jgi:iron-sulfur cluster repair protein YtfE (RIC family)